MRRTGVHHCMTSTVFQHGLLDLSKLHELFNVIYTLLACISQSQLCGSRWLVPSRAEGSSEPGTSQEASGNPPLCEWIAAEHLGHPTSSLIHPHGAV